MDGERSCQGLTERQRLFVAEYLKDGNASAAAVRAGYSRGRAAREGYRLRNLPRVREAIEAARSGRLRAARISRDRVLEELALIAFADIGDFVRWDGDGVALRPMDALSPGQRACVAEIVEGSGKAGKTLRVKLHGKIAALAALERLLGGQARRDEALPRQLVVVTAVPEPDPPQENDACPAPDPLPAGGGGP